MEADLKRLMAVVIATTLSAGMAQAAPDGATLYKSRCGTCHFPPDVMPQQMRMGPSLRGVVGRKAGTLATFPRYSKAMKTFGQPWTPQRLDAYLENPRKVVPGTIMAYAGLKAPAERAAVVAYLSKPGAR